VTAESSTIPSRNVASTYGGGDQAARERSSRVIVVIAPHDGANLRYMTGVAGMLLGLVRTWRA
jgi:hypothetical protein